MEMDMKLKTVIDANETERVEIYAHTRNEIVKAIEQLFENEKFELIGYTGSQGILLCPESVCCFIVEDDKTYALVGKQKLRIKQRLYQIEERVGKDFIKINQSSLANITQIERFDASISGTIHVKFKNGYSDYVSRRNLKQVKERLGI